MREVLVSEECYDFVEENEKRIQRKFQYLLQILIEQPFVNTKFVKKLSNSKFYELRIKANNEYRVMLFSCDHKNFNESQKAILLNGFLKKSNKDYKKAIEIAEKLLIKYKDQIS